MNSNKKPVWKFLLSIIFLVCMFIASSEASALYLLFWGLSMSMMFVALGDIKKKKWVGVLFGLTIVIAYLALLFIGLISAFSNSW